MAKEQILKNMLPEDADYEKLLPTVLSNYCKTLLSLILELEEGYEYVSKYDGWDDFLAELGIDKSLFEKDTGINLNEFDITFNNNNQ